MEAAKQVHNIPPLYDEDSRILVLGSFPSIKSREAAFFYGHPQNRYWKVLPFLLGEPLPETVEEKAAMMHKHHVAMWDSIGSCTITGFTGDAAHLEGQLLTDTLASYQEAVVDVLCTKAFDAAKYFGAKTVLLRKAR